MSDHPLPYRLPDADSEPPPPLSLSPFRIAVIYLLVGSLWILFSDQLLAAVIADPRLGVVLQTVKGMGFIAGSTLLIYGLVLRRDRELQRANRRTEFALEQVDVLHRILRHNLRNSCNLMLGRLELLKDDATTRQVETIDQIRDAGADLVELSDKTRWLRDLLFDEADAVHPVDCVPLVRTQVKRLRREYPEAELRTDLPDELYVVAHQRIEVAIAELIENGILHSGGSTPTVEISAEAAGSTAQLRVTDNGPGMPGHEASVFESGVESDLHHSEGVGLWIVRTVVQLSGGDVAVRYPEEGGTVVTVTVPTST